MRILHLSDLHFGAHDHNLIQNVVDKAAEIKPDVVLVTGDLADQPTPDNFRDAFGFLDTIVQRCNAPASPNDPRLIVIPGNHDVRYLFGTLWTSRRHYKDATKECVTDHYYVDHNVWVYGMDSSCSPGVGANGAISQEEFSAFNHKYQELQAEHGTRFDQAFKIIALHHHPLPVKENAQLQRWLILENAGTLLAVSLMRHIDLIVHGHEHVQARSRFRSSLGGNHPTTAELNVVSSGSTLKLGEHNWLNVLSIRADHTVTLEAYASPQATTAFSEQPEVHHIRAHVEARERHFALQAKEHSFTIREAIFTAELNADGATLNAVQLEDIRINDPIVAAAKLKTLIIPKSKNGYIDPEFVRVRALRGAELGGLHFSEVRNQTAQLEFGRHLHRDDQFSIEYTWNELNAFGMDEYQFDEKYGTGGSHMEMALFPVTQPIEDLTIIIKFPKSFRHIHEYTLSTALTIKVLHADPTNSNNRYELTDLEADLRHQGALRYVEALNLASLRVKRPPTGHFYGIAWKVPPLPPPKEGAQPEAGRTPIERVQAAFARQEHTATKPWRKKITALLETLAKLFHKELLVGRQVSAEQTVWDGDLDLSIMIYDKKASPPVLKDVGAIRYHEFDPENPKGHSGFTHFNENFEYGAGVAGTAYKTNEYRLWIRRPAHLRDSPDYYQPRRPDLKHEVLLTMPLQNPHDERFAYGVINCGSTSDLSPLREVGRTDNQKIAMRNLQTSINKFCLEVFEEIATQYEVE